MIINNNYSSVMNGEHCMTFKSSLFSVSIINNVSTNNILITRSVYLRIITCIPVLNVSCNIV